MREGWEVSTIGDALQVNPKMGKLEDSAPFVTMSDVAEWGKFAYPSGEKGSRGGIRAKGGDVLFARITPCLENGKIGKLPDGAPPTGGSTEFIVLRGSENATSDFAFLLAQSNHVYSSAVALMTGSTGRQRVAASDVARIPINLPPLREQKRIVDLMDSVDAAISAAQAEVDAVSALQSRVLAKEMGSTGADWEKVTFGEVADTLLGKALSRGEGQTEGGTPYLRYANVSWGAIDSTDLNRMTFTESEAEKYSLRVGDLLVAEARHVGKCAVVSESLDGICYQNSLHRVRADESRTSTAFLALVLRHLVNDGTVARFTTAQTIPHLSQGKLRSLPFNLPPLHVQQSIVSTMGTLTTTAEAAQASLDRLRDLRSSMLSVLLSGEHEIPATYDQFLDLSEVVQAG